MRALVTGGAGFVGSNLALELERRGHEVVVLDDFSVGSFKNLEGFRGDVVAADAARGSDWTDRVGAVDAVFHQAAITDTTLSDQMRMMRANVEAFRTVLRFAAGAGARRVVYASSAGVYGLGEVPMRESQEPAPANIYAFSKRVMERVAADFTRDNPQLGVTGLRYFNVYGPREAHKGAAASMIWQLALQMRSGRRPRIFKFGEQCRDFVHVRDAVDANILALEASKNGIFNVCAGEKATFNRVIELLNKALGTRLEPEYFDNPYSTFYQNETLGDPRAAAAGLRFSARVPIETGIREYVGGTARAEPAAAGTKG